MPKPQAIKLPAQCVVLSEEEQLQIQGGEVADFINEVYKLGRVFTYIGRVFTSIGTMLNSFKTVYNSIDTLTTYIKKNY